MPSTGVDDPKNKGNHWFLLFLCVRACVHSSVVRLVQIVACDIMFRLFFVNGRPVRGFLSATRNARDSSRCPVHARHR
jgi:hypothetical protein